MTLASLAVDWYAARAAGVVAYLLLSSVVVLGLALAAAYRPLWTGLGIAAAELLLALSLANPYRKRIAYRLWRRVHYVNFAVWLAATAHGLGAGTDRASRWFLALYVGAVSLVAALGLRGASRGGRRGRRNGGRSSLTSFGAKMAR